MLGEGPLQFVPGLGQGEWPLFPEQEKLRYKTREARISTNSFQSGQRICGVGTEAEWTNFNRLEG